LSCGWACGTCGIGLSEIGPISWQRSGSGLTHFADITHMTFTYQGKTVHLRTRYLQDLFYQYHRVYNLSL